MTTHVLPSQLQHFEARELSRSWPWTRYLVPVGRVFLALMFIMAGPAHFSSEMIRYAALQGVPAASVLVPLAGIIAFVGGLSLALGFWTRIGALLLVVFLVPVTLTMHAF
jgi:putative oxidoreductase